MIVSLLLDEIHHSLRMLAIRASRGDELDGYASAGIDPHGNAVDPQLSVFGRESQRELGVGLKDGVCLHVATSQADVGEDAHNALCALVQL